jgi:hypothetical protein
VLCCIGLTEVALKAGGERRAAGPTFTSADLTVALIASAASDNSCKSLGTVTA